MSKIKPFAAFSQLDESHEKKSAALACRRFKGIHSFHKIASTLDTIRSEFVGKPSVARTITDNASNFVKAFSQFQSQVYVNNFKIDNLNGSDSLLWGHSFSTYAQREGEGGKQKRTPYVQGGMWLKHGSTYAKTSLFCTLFVIFSYAGSFFHTLLSLV